jgi:DNA-binding LytR/AlgR family response regulator
VIESVQQAVEWFITHPEPDLVFMDIQLDDGICFEIFEAVQVNAPVIFTTAFNEYALKAFKVNSIDYLLKPVDAGQLHQALEKFRKLYPAGSGQHTGFNELISQLTVNYKSRFFVRVGDHCRSVPVTDIRYICIIERSVFMKAVSGQHFALEYSLDQLQKMLDPKVFFRINRTHIININYVQDIIAWSASRLKITIRDEKDNPDLIVSRDKVSSFKKWLDR